MIKLILSYLYVHPQISKYKFGILDMNAQPQTTAVSGAGCSNEIHHSCVQLNSSLPWQPILPQQPHIVNVSLATARSMVIKL